MVHERLQPQSDRLLLRYVFLNTIREFKPQRRLRQRKRPLKINIFPMVTILRSLRFCHILYCCKITLQMVW